MGRMSTREGEVDRYSHIVFRVFWCLFFGSFRPRFCPQEQEENRLKDEAAKKLAEDQPDKCDQ